jgi:predicted enzyme related to lactoylglutathione lyase
MQPIAPEGNAPSVAFDPGNPGQLRLELAAADAAAALSFYTALFGWSLPDPMDMGEHGFYHFIADGETQIGAAYNKMPQDPVPHWNHYFQVPGIKAAAAAIADKGGRW